VRVEWAGKLPTSPSAQLATTSAGFETRNIGATIAGNSSLSRISHALVVIGTFSPKPEIWPRTRAVDACKRPERNAARHFLPSPCLIEYSGGTALVNARMLS
jgi:hypothetical protein